MASNEFYSINDIQKQLYCSYCEHRIDIPKILPCGNTICSKCEASYSQSPDKECKSCADTHQIPKNGFPVNKLVSELLKITPAKVYRGDVHQLTMDLVNEIGILNKNLQGKIENINLFVADYCDMLRTCVDIKTESEINQLNKHRDLFLSQIDSYEKQCKEKSSHESLKFDEFILKCNENYAKWAQFLNKESISDKETSAVLKDATAQMNELVEFRNKFEKSIFGSRKLMFYENKKQTMPGCLGLITGCVNQEQGLQFNYNTEQATYYKPFLVKTDDTTVCLATSFTNNQGLFFLKLSIITNSVVVKEIKEPIHASYYNHYSILIFKHSLLVHFCLNTGQPVLRMYDYDLKLIKSVNHSHVVTGLFTDEKLIYGYAPNNALWLIYDENLNLKESIAIGNGSAYPYIMNNASQVELKNGYLFSYFNRELRVIDNEKRTLLVSLKLDDRIFPNPIFVKPCSTDSFYVIDSTSKTVQVLDFELNCFHEFKIDSVSQMSSVSMTQNGEIVVYDHTKTTAYLLKN